jgi:hypothetical protein
LTPYEWLLFDVLDQKPPIIQNVSFRTPNGTSGRILNVEVFPFDESSGSRFFSIEKKWKDLLNPFLFKTKKTTSAFWSVKTLKDNMRFISVACDSILYKTFPSFNITLSNGFATFLGRRYKIDSFLIYQRKFNRWTKKKFFDTVEIFLLF